MQEDEEEFVYEEEEDTDLAGALSSEFKSAPWYVSSMAIHCLVFLLLLVFAPDMTPREKPPIVIKMEIPIEEEPLPEPLTDIEENIPEVITETQVTEPAPVIVTTDFEVADHNETADEMEDSSALGDPDNISTFDSEAEGTPALMGVGASGGKGGGGRFGSRLGGKRNLVAKNGGNRHTEASVQWGLKWLAAHQEADGHWDNAKYGGGGHSAGDVGVSSLALLAFLGAGNSTKFGKYRDNVKRATTWLMSQQAANGCIGPHRYNAGIALMAIAESYGMSMDAKIKVSAQRAVDWATKSQHKAGGWGYVSSSKDNRNDTSVFGWWCMGIKSAKVSGLIVPSEVFERARDYIMQATTEPKAADDGYGRCRTSYSSSTDNLQGVKRGGGSPRLTAVANTCLQFLGRKRDDTQVSGTANQIIADGVCTPANQDFYRWYYAALGIFQMGVRSDYWEKWNGSMKTSLLSMQVKEGTFAENKGSWNFEADKYGSAWGRVGETALGCLMLEVYYRYESTHKK